MRWFLCMLVLVLLGTSGKADSAKLVFEETPLEALGHPAADAWGFQLNATATLAVWWVSTEGPQSIAINGKPGPTFDWIEGPSFTGDEKHVHYDANRGGKRGLSHWASEPTGGRWFQVIDSQEGAGYADREQLDKAWKPMFKRTLPDAFSTKSVDGKHNAVATSLNKGMCIVVDGKAGPVYDSTLWPVFSQDASRLAYVAYRVNHARPSGDNFVVLDGKEEAIYDTIDNGPNSGTTLCFSPDGKHVAYVARTMDHSGDHSFVVLDGKKQEEQDEHYPQRSLVFSPDSRWLVYSEGSDYNRFIVIRSVADESFAKSQNYREVWLRNDQVSGSIHFFGVRDQTIYRVETKPSE